MYNRLFKLSFVAALTFGLQPDALAEIKCWINHEGVRECGNVVPPEYSQEGHREYSERGFVVDETGRAPTEAEIMDQRRESQRQMEAERLRTEQARQDRILLQTFSDEEDIINARDDKIAVMEAQIKLAEGRIAKLQSDLDQRIKQAASMERTGKTPSESIQEDIDSLRRQIRSNETYITNTREKQAQLQEAYAADIERFRELKGDN